MQSATSDSLISIMVIFAAEIDKLCD